MFVARWIVRLDVRAAARMFLLAVVVPMSGIRSEEPVRPSVRPLAVSAEARAAMTWYSFAAHEVSSRIELSK